MRPIVLLAALLMPMSTLAAEAESVAVLELENQSHRVKTEEVQFITDLVRRAATEGLDRTRYRVMTRETMEVIVPPQEMKCLAGKCLVEIGKKLQAKFVVGGSVKDFGTKIAVTLEAYDAMSGMLIGSETGTPASVDEAGPVVQQMGARLMQKIGGGTPGTALGGGGQPAGGGGQPASGGGGPSFQVSAMAAIPTVAAVSGFDARATGLDFGNVDVEALERYDQVTTTDAGSASPEEKARAWRDLASKAPQFAVAARARADEWDRNAAQLKAAAEARRQRVAARDKDWERLSRLLPLKVVGDDDKKKWAKTFVDAYGNTWDDNPYLAELAPYLPKGTVKGLEGYVRIPAGTFQMGSPGSESGRSGDETQHRVRITHAFLMKATEVTQGEWKAVFANNPSSFSSCGNDCPVENVSWWEAVSYANALSRKEGLPECYELSGCGGTPGDKSYSCSGARSRGLSCAGYRLPTEAEWEYAARAGTETPYYTGNSADDAAWYSANSDNKTHPAGRKRANAWGLSDMLGNVWEWCGDWFGSYAAGETADPVGADTGSTRVLRGGSWRYDASFVRAAARDNVVPGYRNGNLGFRLARSLVR